MRLEQRSRGGVGGGEKELKLWLVVEGGAVVESRGKEKQNKEGKGRGEFERKRRIVKEGKF